MSGVLGRLDERDMYLVPSATVRTRGLPLTRRLLCLLSYEGNEEIHFGCARTRASRRTRCLAARGLASDRAHPGPPTPCRVASECTDTPEVERMTSLELVASAMAWPRSAN